MTVLEPSTSAPEICKLFILKLTSDTMAGFVAAAVFIFPCLLAQATSQPQNTSFYEDEQTSCFGAPPCIHGHQAFINVGP